MAKVSARGDWTSFRFRSVLTIKKNFFSGLVGAKNFFKNHRDVEGEDEANQSTTEIHEAKVDIFWESHKNLAQCQIKNERWVNIFVAFSEYLNFNNKHIIWSAW